MKKTKNIVVNDPIADMLTRIRNAIKARFETVQIPHSSVKAVIAKILLDEGYLEKVTETKDEAGHPRLQLDFKLHGGKQRVIQGLRRISKPGLRVYTAADELPKVLNGLGIAIISTNKGIMTDAQARKENVGGEVLAYVW